MNNQEAESSQESKSGEFLGLKYRLSAEIGLIVYYLERNHCKAKIRLR